jgi:hypothetical protein
MNETNEYNKKSGFSMKGMSESPEMNTSCPNLMGYSHNFIHPNLYNNLCNSLINI